MTNPSKIDKATGLTTPHGSSRFRASQLIDCKITNAREEHLGDVKDIVLASDNHSIAYVVVAFGGFLGMGEKYFAMPWRLIDLSWDAAEEEPRINLNVDQEVLKAAPGFDKARWPDMVDMTWTRQVEDFYRTTGSTSEAETMSSQSGTGNHGVRSGEASGRDPNTQTFHHRRVSQLIGMDVVDMNRKTLATVDDLVLDAERAQIEGVALSFGGVIGMGKQIAIVPVEFLTLDRKEGTFTLPCNTTDLEALALPGGEWPALESDDWVIRGRQQCELASNLRSD